MYVFSSSCSSFIANNSSSLATKSVSDLSFTIIFCEFTVLPLAKVCEARSDTLCRCSVPVRALLLVFGSGDLVSLKGEGNGEVLSFLLRVIVW